MRKEQEQLLDFMKKADQYCATRPDVCSVAIHALRGKLIREELEEYYTACAMGHLTGIADAIGDLLYVVIGTAVSHGIDIDPIFQEIHRSNMTKFIDGHKREDGKWVKGPSYEPANLKPIIDAQLNK